MVFTRENAREFKNAPMAKLQAVFGDRLFGDACATPTDTEALHVVGACGMEFYAPVSDYILNTPGLFCYIASFGAANHLFAFDGGNVRHYTDDGEKLLPEDFIKDELEKLCPEQDVHSFTKGPGIHYDEYHLQISWRTGMIELGDEVVIDAITKICNNNVKYTHKYSSTYIFKWAGTVREQLNDLAIEIYKKYGVEDQDYNDSLLARGIFK